MQNNWRRRRWRWWWWRRRWRLFGFFNDGSGRSNVAAGSRLAG
jgi:hypothetical protein